MGMAFELSFEVNTGNNQDKKEEQIYLLLANLYHNGQINNDYFLVKRDEIYYAYVTCADKDAMELDNCSAYTKELLNEIKINAVCIGENVENQQICTCGKHESYLLSYIDTINGSPIRCKKCGREIPLYHLQPIDSQDDFFYLMKWKEVCAALDCIWRNTSMDKIVQTQISDRKSEFWEFTEQIRKNLEQQWGKNVEVEIPEFDLNM